MPTPRDPLSFLLGLLLGLSTPVIMGCFSSKPDPISSSAPQKTQPQQAASIPQPQQTPPVAAPVSEPPVAADKVANVPKPPIEITAHDKASLKLRSLQDKLTAALSASDNQLRLYGQEALRQHRASNPIAAQLLIQERSRLQTKVNRQQQEVSRLAEMVDKMDEAKQNKDLLEALDKGNAMIAEVMQEFGQDKLQNVLDKSDEMKQAVHDVSDAMAADADQLTQDELDMQMAELEKEFGAPEPVQQDPVQQDPVQHDPVHDKTLQTVANIPDVPQEQPPAPQPAAPQAAAAEPAPEDRLPIAEP
eukprot:GFKZ01003172.1.p1 GENE.GFKZ01003172.1~~GFKZ01003172.1.p1  ORF type:complete len:304 (+),score=57.06 GFKZ01003172.1:548-1459(+)